MTLEEVFIYFLILLIVTTLYTKWKPQHSTNCYPTTKQNEELSSNLQDQLKPRFDNVLYELKEQYGNRLFDLKQENSALNCVFTIFICFINSII